MALEKIDEEVRRPGGLGKMRGKLNELWALLGAVNAATERDRLNGNVEWAVVDEDGLGQITQVCRKHTMTWALVDSFVMMFVTDPRRGTSRFGTPDEDLTKGFEGCGRNPGCSCERRGD